MGFLVVLFVCFFYIKLCFEAVLLTEKYFTGKICTSADLYSNFGKLSVFVTASEKLWPLCVNVCDSQV